MTKKTTFAEGDRIAFSRAFLRLTGNDYATAQRRGTFIRLEGHSNLARVRWADYDYTPGSRDLAEAADRNGDDYAEDVAKNGSCVNVNNICRVGSVAFAD